MEYDEIRTAWIQSRKDKDILATKVLSGIIDKTQKLTKAKNDTDENKYLMQAIKNEFNGYKDSHEKGIDSIQEIDFISKFIPKTLSKEETTIMIQTMIDSIPNLKFADIMKFCKSREELDMKVVQEIAKSILK